MSTTTGAAAEGQEPAAPAAEPPPAPSGQRGWIISPAIDLLCVGGLSLLVLLPWVLLRRRITIGQIALLSVLINMPHFLASYVLLYRNKEQVLRYKLASIGVPLALLAYSVFAVASASHTNVHVANFAAFAGLYLAWHYTGQTWGMIATFGYLSGRPFDGLEGQLVRGGLRVLLVWHVCWFLYVGRAPFFPPWLQASIDQAYAILSVVAGASLVLGVVGFVRYARRVGHAPPLHVLVPWLALHVWYAYMALDPHPRALFWVQLGHALQYLIFPVRVEANRALDETRGHRVVRSLVFLALLVLAGLFFTYGLTAVLSWPAAATWGYRSGEAVPVVAFAFLNVHHYFVDSCIWKLSNPTVRKQLMAHVAPPTAPAAQAAPAA